MSTRAWQFASGRAWPVDAQEAGDELDRIREANGGELRADSVVVAAADPANVLHPCFEWDDTRAGALYRKEQASSLCRSIRVLVVNEDGDKEPLRAYVCVLPDGADRRAYVPRGVVAANPNLLNQAINEAIQYLRYAENRVAEFKALRAESKQIAQVRLRLEERPELHP